MIRRLAILAATLLVACTDTPELPFYGSRDLTPTWERIDHVIAPFSLTDQRGERFDSTELIGKIYVASFIYTSCAGICPPMVTNLHKVQEAFADDPDVTIVSFTVTPDSDTPEQLAHFAEMRHIGWNLLTGERDVIYGLARDSYFAEDGNESTFLHTESFFLIDGNGRIRGVYNGTRAFDVEMLIEDIGILKS